MSSQHHDAVFSMANAADPRDFSSFSPRISGSRPGSCRDCGRRSYHLEQPGHSRFRPLAPLGIVGGGCLKNETEVRWSFFNLLWSTVTLEVPSPMTDPYGIYGSTFTINIPPNLLASIYHTYMDPSWIWPEGTNFWWRRTGAAPRWRWWRWWPWLSPWSPWLYSTHEK